MEEEASLTWGPPVSCLAGGCAADLVQASSAGKHGGLPRVRGCRDKVVEG